MTDIGSPAEVGENWRDRTAPSTVLRPRIPASTDPSVAPSVRRCRANRNFSREVSRLGQPTSAAGSTKTPTALARSRSHKPQRRLKGDPIPDNGRDFSLSRVAIRIQTLRPARHHQRQEVPISRRLVMTCSQARAASSSVGRPPPTRRAESARFRDSATALQCWHALPAKALSGFFMATLPRLC